MDLLIYGLESRKNGEKYHDCVIDDAIGHIKRAQECLDEGLKNPEQWYKDCRVVARTFVTLFPYIYLLQQFHSEKEQNSPTSPDVNQVD